MWNRGLSDQTLSFLLSSAKYKSINVLASKLKLVNTICPIFRKLGKCSAHNSGRCTKNHDPKYVSLCPNVLKGKCTNEKCLLSHETSLSKMPVCKFFLEGLCNKNDCLYLHKKLSDNTTICTEFVRGFCPLADKVCNSFLFKIFNTFYTNPLIFQNVLV